MIARLMIDSFFHSLAGQQDSENIPTQTVNLAQKNRWRLWGPNPDLFLLIHDWKIGIRGVGVEVSLSLPRISYPDALEVPDYYMAVSMPSNGSDPWVGFRQRIIQDH